MAETKRSKTGGPMTALGRAQGREGACARWIAADSVARATPGLARRD
jgi:hypothetical protein